MTALGHQERRDAEADARTEPAAAAAVPAQVIIDLDKRYARRKDKSKFARGYRSLVSDYTNLLPDLDRETPSCGPGSRSC